MRNGLLAAILVILFSLLPAVVSAAVIEQASTVADEQDAQQGCVAPVNDFLQQLDGQVASGQVPGAFRQTFVQHVEQCRAIYLHELVKLEADFAALPETSYCHQTTGEFREALEVIDDIGEKARQLPMDSPEDSLIAGSFFKMTGPGLIRAVNGLFLLRHGICMEEQIQPF